MLINAFLTMTKNKVVLKPLRRKSKNKVQIHDIKSTFVGFVSIIVIIFCIFFINNQFASAGIIKVYYVDQMSIGGRCSDSNSGTISSPFCTISKAVSQLTPGSKLIVRKGTYSPFEISKNGTFNEPISIVNYPGEIAQIVSEEKDVVVLVNKSQFITINGLEIVNKIANGGVGVKVDQSSNIVIENNSIFSMGSDIHGSAVEITNSSELVKVTGNTLTSSSQNYVVVDDNNNPNQVVIENNNEV